MSEETPPPATNPERTTPTRRGVLALVGSIAVAGCTDLPVGQGRDTTELDGAALRGLVADGSKTPQTVPVDVTESYLDSFETRARELLGQVPSPLTEAEVPNGVVRKHVVDARESARDALRQAASARSPYQRLVELEAARVDARFVAATWAAIDGGLTRADVVAEASGLQQATEDVRDRWQYVGSDPVRSVVVHEEIENRLRRAASSVENLRDSRTHQPGEVLDVGELAEDAERARTNAGTAAYLYEQYADSLDERREMESTFETARATLVETVRERTRDRLGDDDDPPEPSSLVEVDVEGTPAVAVLRELTRDLLFEDWNGAQNVAWPATDVSRAHEQLVRHRALDDVVARIEEGETYAVEEIADVRALRDDAVRAVSKALSGSDVSALTRNLVPEVAWRIEFADRRLADFEGTVRASRLDDVVVEYVVAAAMVAATPAVSNRVGSVLQSA
jgi:hypothetical protein